MGGPRAFKGPDLPGPLPTLLFRAEDLFPPGADAGFTKRGGGGASMQALAPGRWNPRYATGPRG